MFWTLGVYHIVNDTMTGKSGMPLFSKAAVKKIFSMPLIGFLAGLAMTLLSVHIPDFMMTSFQYVGNIATPMALIIIGIEMSAIPLAHIKWDRDVIGALVGRFIVCPVCVLILLPFFPVTDISAKVFTMQASMPAMTNMTIVAKSVGADVEYSTTVSFISIILGMVVIPIYMVILG
jgi:predicted permease